MFKRLKALQLKKKWRDELDKLKSEFALHLLNNAYSVSYPYLFGMKSDNIHMSTKFNNTETTNIQLYNSGFIGAGTVNHICKLKTKSDNPLIVITGPNLNPIEQHVLEHYGVVVLETPTPQELINVIRKIHDLLVST